MNCQRGDLAIVIKAPAYPEHIGKIVRCLEWVEWETGEWVWEIDLKIPGALHVVAQDEHLRPIRDNGAADETRADLPSKEGIAA